MPKLAVIALALLGSVVLGSAGAAPLVERPEATMALDVPVLLGVAAACSGSAPSAPSCSTGPFAMDCTWGCWPRVTGTLGYTGWVVATIDGHTADGGSASAWERCEFVAGQVGGVGSVGVGTRCSSYMPGAMYGPFTVRGASWPSSSAVQAALWRGSWTANAVQG